MKSSDPLGAMRTMETEEGPVSYVSLEALEARGPVSRMPMTLKILLESVVRRLDGRTVTEDHVAALIGWKSGEGEIPFQPARVVMQDFTGVPAVVDMAAMRDSFADLGGDPRRINPLIPVDLVIDHSVQVDRFGTGEAFRENAELELQRNRERYQFLRWASGVFDDLTVVPPATGIVHQVNLEYLARVVQTRKSEGAVTAFPDTVLGTDSHTTMINGLGVLGWGVGGIEAEAAMLGQPLVMPVTAVIGFRLTGDLPGGATATDLVLTVTQILRKYGVVGKFVEFFGPGLESLSLANRATISNMCPEYGATAALFPVDDQALRYLRNTGRPAELVKLVERYCRAQGLFRTAETPDPEFSDVVELDMGTVTPSIAGPKRPQDRIGLSDAANSFRKFLATEHKEGPRRARVLLRGKEVELADGAIVISAITSCTNTSNPYVMVGAGLLARKAVERGLSMPPWVKTSLAPGSRVVTRYLDLAGLSPFLDQLGYNLVGYGCTTCIGNSGPIDAELGRAIEEADIVAAAVLSGNRNFEGRIHASVRANYLASPPLVIAFGLAGRIDIDLDHEPLGTGSDGKPVFLRDIWPTLEEIDALVQSKVSAQLFREEYAGVYKGTEAWRAIEVKGGDRYGWEADSTYIRRPPFFEGLSRDVPTVEAVTAARILAVLGDSVTTDHISPAGMISDDSPAAEWLKDNGVLISDFNTFGSRRGNHEVMMRGTFGNIRIRNRLVPDKEGSYTRHLPDGEVMSIYDAAMRYRGEGTPLVVLAGADYGMGSSRDWAAKGAALLGVRAVIAQSYERIHRSNLIGMGVLPLQFPQGQSAESLGLRGEEVLDIDPVSEPGQTVRVVARGIRETAFLATVRIDTSVEMDYYRNGGILHALLRSMAPDKEPG